MKYLRKFATEAQYAAFVNGDYVTPNVSLVGKSVEYTKIIGVFIQHINGQLFTSEEWETNGYSATDANGVAVSDVDVSFVMAKSRLGSSAWATQTGLIEGVAAAGDVTKAEKDIKGQSNTEYIIASGNAIAAQACADYVFPNGKKGYLGSFGEWNIAFKYKNEIQTAATLIGGPTFASEMWTSSQKNETNAWAFIWSTGSNYSYNKSTKSFTYIPFAPLNI